MKSIKKTFNRPLALAFAVLIGIVAYQAFAMRPGPTKPALVATVNLEYVYDALEEQNAANAELNRLKDEIEAKAESMRQEIQRLGEDMEGVFTPGSQQAKQTEEQLVFKAYYLREYREQSVVQLDVEQAKVLSELYDSIKETIARIAEENGYDLVLVDDSVVELPGLDELSAGGARREMMRQISARRMLYTSPAIDISQMVVDRMNGAFQARGG